MKWENEAVLLLDELVQPIPLFVRSVAKNTIKKQIEKLVNTEDGTVQVDHVIHGYILTGKKKDPSRIRGVLDAKNIDYSKYEHLLK